MRVVSVKQGSLAQQAGVRPGDIILTVNEHTVGTHAQAVTLIDASAKGLVRLGLLKMERSGSSSAAFAMAG